MGNQPYTYLVGWSVLGKFYYGVRTAKDCHPSDLWVKYFTSSNKVKEHRVLYGEPDIICVRRLHKSKAIALHWEEKVIRRMNAVRSKGWLNQQNAGKFFGHNGFPRSLECREKIRQAILARLDSDEEFRLDLIRRAKIVGSTPEARKKISLKAKERFKDPEYAQRNIDSHNTEEYKRKQSEDSKRRMQDVEYKKMVVDARRIAEIRKREKTMENKIQ